MGDATGAARPTLQAFLRATNPHQAAHIVLGNEAADLDSVATAIAYAYLSDIRPTPVPVINIPRAHLRLRRDVQHALSLAGISSTDPPLRFIDELPAPAAVTLVDHNTLASHQAALAPRVVAVVDHHADERLFPSATPRVVAPVASCATLVAEIATPDRDTARLLLCAILIDCANMAPDGKATARDRAAVERLAPVAGWLQNHRHRVFSELSAARADIHGFSLHDLLWKDMKVIQQGAHRVAVSTVTLPMRQMVELDQDLAVAVETFRSDRVVDCVIIMNSYREAGSHQRQLCVQDNTLGHAIAKHLVNDDSLQLATADVKGAGGLLCFQQRNIKPSRKAVAPILKQILSSELLPGSNPNIS